MGIRTGNIHFLIQHGAAECPVLVHAEQFEVADHSGEGFGVCFEYLCQQFQFVEVVATLFLHMQEEVHLKVEADPFVSHLLAQADYTEI